MSTFLSLRTMEDRWPEVADEAISISNFNSKFGWNQEDSVEWQYPLMKEGVPTEQSIKCPVTMSLLRKGIRDVEQDKNQPSIRVEKNSIVQDLFQNVS